MTIRKRYAKSTEEWRYRAELLITTDGKRSTALGSHGWTDAATAKSDDLALRTSRGTGRLAASEATVALYLERYIGELEITAANGKPLGRTTATKYRDQARYVAGVIGEVRLTALREEHVIELRRELISRLAPGTVHGVLSFLGRALDVAERRGYLRVPNPAAAKAVRRPRAKAGAAPVLEPATSRKILAAVGSDPILRAAVPLALGATLRRAEVLGLRWSAVDLEAGVITIASGSTYTVGGWSDPKSDAGAREIPMPAFVIAALRAHREAQPAAPIADALVLANPHTGEPYTPTSLSRAWRLFREAHPELVPAGMTFHDLRHGAAQALIESGLGREVIKRVAGWSADAMPEHYAPGLTAEARRDVARRLETQLGAG